MKVQRSIATYRGQIEFCDVDVSNPHQHVLRRAAKPDEKEGSYERRNGRVSHAGAARTGRGILP